MSPQQSTYDPIDPRVRQILTLGIPISLLAAGALSVQGLYELAVHVGWPRAVAWLLPVAVEVYAGLSTLTLFGTKPSYREGRKRAGKNAIVAVGLSVGLNELWHLIDHGVLPMGWGVVVATSAVPPTIVAALLHLTLSLPSEVAQDRPVTESRSVSLTKKRPLPAGVPGAGSNPVPQPEPVPNGQQLQRPSVPAPVATVGGREVPHGDEGSVPLPPARKKVAGGAAVRDSEAVPSTNKDLTWRPPVESVVALQEVLSQYRPEERVTSRMLAEKLGKTDSWWRRVRRWVEDQEAVQQSEGAVA